MWKMKREVSMNTRFLRDWLDSNISFCNVDYSKYLFFVFAHSCCCIRINISGANFIFWILQLTVWLRLSLLGDRFQLPTLSVSRMILPRDMVEEKLQQQLPIASTKSLGNLFFFFLLHLLLFLLFCF